MCKIILKYALYYFIQAGFKCPQGLIILEILYRIIQFSSLLTIMSCNKGRVAARIIFPLFFINLSKSYSDIFFCVDILITLFTGIACYRKTEKKIMLFSGPKRQAADV